MAQQQASQKRKGDQQRSKSTSNSGRSGGTGWQGADMNADMNQDERAVGSEAQDQSEGEGTDRDRESDRGRRQGGKPQQEGQRAAGTLTAENR